MASEKFLEGLEMLGESQVARSIAAVFKQIEMAEEEIKAARQKWPAQEQRLWRAFPIMRSPILEDVEVMRAGSVSADRLFRAHCRQLLRYIGEGVNLDRPTLVEVAVIVCNLSERAPVQAELVSMVQADRETMAAFGLEAISAFEKTGEMYWPDLERACQKVYREKRGKTRSKLFEEIIRRD